MNFILRSKPKGLFLDLAPLIDVVFLLLIFLMVASRFLQPVIGLELPRSQANSQADRTAIVLTINRDGLILLDNQVVRLEDLAQKASELMKQKDRDDFILQADRQVSFDLFVKVMEQIRQGGASTLNIETKP